MITDTLRETAASKWAIDLKHSSMHLKVRHISLEWMRGALRILRARDAWERLPGRFRQRTPERKRIRSDVEYGAVAVIWPASPFTRFDVTYFEETI